MQLDVGLDRARIAPRLRDPARVVPGARHRVDQRLAVQRTEGRHLREVETAGERARAEEAPVAAFLIAPGHHREGTPDGQARLPDRLQALETGQHPQRAIERPALGHGVDVGAGQHRGAVAGEEAEGVAGRVHARLEARGLHAAEQPRARLLVCRAPARAGDPVAIRVATEGGKGLDVLLEALQRDARGGHGRREYTAHEALTLSRAGS